MKSGLCGQILTDDEVNVKVERHSLIKKILNNEGLFQMIPIRNVAGDLFTKFSNKFRLSKAYFDTLVRYEIEKLLSLPTTLPDCFNITCELEPNTYTFNVKEDIATGYMMYQNGFEDDPPVLDYLTIENGTIIDVNSVDLPDCYGSNTTYTNRRALLLMPGGRVIISGEPDLHFGIDVVRFNAVGCGSSKVTIIVRESPALTSNPQEDTDVFEFGTSWSFYNSNATSFRSCWYGGTIEIIADENNPDAILIDGIYIFPQCT